MSSEKEKKGRKKLTLKERVDIIEYSKKNPGLGSRNIASVFQVWQNTNSKNTAEKGGNYGSIRNKPIRI